MYTDIYLKAILGALMIRVDKHQNEQNMQVRYGSTLFHINDLRIYSWQNQIVTVWLTACSALAMIFYSL